MKVKALISLLLLAASLASLAKGDAMAPLFEQYHQLQSHLAGDDFTSASKAVHSLSQSVQQVNDDQIPAELTNTWRTAAGQLRAAVDKGKSAQDIDELRRQFQSISNVMVMLYQTAQPEGFSQFHCPMAFNNTGADWLQKADSAKNPYFGKMMLGCGAKVRSAKKSDDHSGHQH